MITTLLLTTSLNCMTAAIWEEARGTSLEDKADVASVILNRVADTRFPDTVCGVVKQRRHGLSQFAWYHGQSKIVVHLGKKDVNLKTRKSWFHTKALAKIAVDGYLLDNTKGALFFNSSKKLDKFFTKLERVKSNTSGHQYFRCKKC